jgi:hypothetical protein
LLGFAKKRVQKKKSGDIDNRSSVKRKWYYFGGKKMCCNVQPLPWRAALLLVVQRNEATNSLVPENQNPGKFRNHQE